MNGPILTGGKPRLPKVGVGWPLLGVPNADGGLDWPDPGVSIKQMIEIILRTTPGEQLMRPRFGAGTEAMIWQPNTVTTRARAQEAIIAALADYEPRIVIDRVDVDEGADPREMTVSIAYRVSLTGAPAVVTASVPVGGG